MPFQIEQTKKNAFSSFKFIWIRKRDSCNFLEVGTATVATRGRYCYSLEKLKNEWDCVVRETQKGSIGQLFTVYRPTCKTYQLGDKKTALSLVSVCIENIRLVGTNRSRILIDLILCSDDGRKDWPSWLMTWRYFSNKCDDREEFEELANKGSSFIRYWKITNLSQNLSFNLENRKNVYLQASGWFHIYNEKNFVHKIRHQTRIPRKLSNFRLKLTVPILMTLFFREAFYKIASLKKLMNNNHIREF